MSEAKPAKSAPGFPVARVASDNAPFVFFDYVPALGTCGGVAEMTLSARRLMPADVDADGSCKTCSKDQVVVAHLRTTPAGLLALKYAIAKIEEMMTQGASAAAMGESPSDLLQ